MSIAARQGEIVDEFSRITDWQQRYRRIIELGRALPELPAELRVDANKVKGCQSQVWLHAELRDGNVEYRADSDAAIVRGLIAILLRVYSGSAPDDILASRPEFVDRLGLSSHLSQSRSNGLSAMIRQILYYALAFKARASLDAGRAAVAER